MTDFKEQEILVAFTYRKIFNFTHNNRNTISTIIRLDWKKVNNFSILQNILSDVHVNYSKNKLKL